MSTPSVATDRFSTNALPSDAALRHLLGPIQLLVDQHMPITEMAINEPGQAWVEKDGDWHLQKLPEMSRSKMTDLVKAVAVFCKQDISERSPILSATLPNGYRFQAVIPPALDANQMGICIRIPGGSVRPLESYKSSGAFERWILNRGGVRSSISVIDERLFKLLENRLLFEFLVLAVKSKKNIAIVGDTGSGKTTLMKSLCELIPLSERIITIEDVRELDLRHLNKLHLLYSKSEGVAKITPQDLIAACMRLKPTRTLIAELRGSEAFDFLKLLSAGHSGAITSFHAANCDVALKRFVLMAKEHPNASVFTGTELLELVNQTIDIFVHVTAEPLYGAADDLQGLDRYVTEIRFDPFKGMSGGSL